MTPNVLVARLDNAGDVLLCGPAIRAVAATAGRVTMLCSPAGAAAAHLLPGVDEVIEYDAPWVSFDPPPVQRPDIDRMVDAFAARSFDQAFILTSFHQSPLPLALMLRMAGVPTVAAHSEDYPGALLDVRHPESGGHEVERSLSLVSTLGYRLPQEDHGDLRLRVNNLPPSPVEPPFVVFHPGASVPARGWPPSLAADAVDLLSAQGHRVVVTGSAGERSLTAAVAGTTALDLGGQLDWPELAALLAGASSLVVGNTGPAHLAAAVGTPVVSLFAPVVPLARWQPWGVPTVILGDQSVACAGCRARVCPRNEQLCITSVDAQQVADAVASVRREGALA